MDRERISKSSRHYSKSDVEDTINNDSMTYKGTMNYKVAWQGTSFSSLVHGYTDWPFPFLDDS